MKILVTGGAGFLGSHLCDRLINLKHKVICLDNFYTGSKVNIERHLGSPNFELVNHDIVDGLDDINVEQIYNLACPASPVHYQHDPIQTLKTSVIGAINVLDLAKRNNARVLQASTSEVYGDPEVHPQSEKYRGNVNPIGPRACYDEGKRCAETLFFDYHRQHGIDIRLIRIFNTYGPRMMVDDGRVVSNFVVQALQGNDITVYGDGQQTRSFCYVDDLIDVIIRMMNQNDFIGPVNTGNSNEFTILELAENIINITNSNSKIIFKDLPTDDPMQRNPDSSIVKRELSWAPKIELEEGLVKTVSYFSKIIKKNA
ncbi:MAG: NAD-dependent dehydratase [Rhodopirellula sp.]|nr:NAD-dependent dehydratase [Rhodopirellula sp.]|tara:strand:+ start:8182 stop:9123 length:942 start_codon:yes stop_codon:yes gene_type:complete